MTGPFLQYKLQSFGLIEIVVAFITNIIIIRRLSKFPRELGRNIKLGFQANKTGVPIWNST